MTVTRHIDQIRSVHPWCPWQHCCTMAPRHLVPAHLGAPRWPGRQLAPPHALLLLQEELFSSMSFHIKHFANSITEIACSHFERLIHIMEGFSTQQAMLWFAHRRRIHPPIRPLSCLEQPTRMKNKYAGSPPLAKANSAPSRAARLPN